MPQPSIQPSHCAAWLRLSSTYLSFLQYIDTSLEQHVLKVLQFPWIHSASLRVSSRDSKQPTLSSQYVVITMQHLRGLLEGSRRSWRSSEAFVMFWKISETLRNGADPAAQSRLPTLQLRYEYLAGYLLKEQDTRRSLKTNITLTLTLQMFSPSTSIFSKTTY